MAAPDWTNGNGTNIWSDGANWSTAAKPQAGDTVTFTNTSVANCTVDEVTAEIASLTIGGTTSGDYSGTITGSNKIQMTGNFVIESGCTGTFDLNADIDIDAAFTGDGAIVLCGSGTWTAGGNFDNKDVTTWTRETSTVVMTGNGNTITGASNRDFHNLTISNNTTVDAGTVSRIDVQGALTVASGKTLTLNQSLSAFAGSTHTITGVVSISTGKFFTCNGDVVVTVATGRITGDGQWLLGQTANVTDASGTIDPAIILCHNDVTLGPGTYGSAATVMTCNNTSAGNDRTLTFSAGSFVFPGDITYDNDQAAPRNYIIDQTANPNITYEGDVTISETGGGTLTLNKGTGTITFDGSTTYTDDVGVNLGDVEISATTFTPATNMECDDLTGLNGGFMDGGGADPGVTFTINGDLDWQAGFTVQSTFIKGSTWDVTGNFTANGQSMAAGGGEWFLNIGGTAVASGAGDVKDSNAGGTEIDASANPWTDSGGNTNWNFGAAGLSISIAMHHYKQMMGVN